MEPSKQKKRHVCITLTQEDHDRLTRLARDSGRTLPGYLRWLLHRHFMGLDQASPD